MDRSRQRRSLVRIASVFTLVAGIAPSGHQPRHGDLPVRNLTVPEVTASLPQTSHHVEAIAAKVAARARATEGEEGRQNLVEDNVAVKVAADGRVIVEQLGEASWYGAWHHGRQTASGTLFNQHALTAAHPTLPLGTTATITNLATGRSVDVLINDRGPYVRGRDIDLSRAAAQKIGVVSQGAAAVQIQAWVES